MAIVATIARVRARSRLTPGQERSVEVVGELEVEVARWLVSTEGLDALATVVADLDAGGDELGAASRVRRSGLDGPRATAVLAAATARRRARERWTDADRLVLMPTALAQASGPAVSAWRARRFTDRAVWDLCAGLGGDALALGRTASSVTAIDHDPARLVLLAHNAEVRGVAVTTRIADALRVTPRAGAWIHADPSRRLGPGAPSNRLGHGAPSDRLGHGAPSNRVDGRRVRRLAEHTPPVRALLEAHAGAPAQAVALSPAVDLDDPDLPADAELEFVAVGDRLVETVAWRGAARDGPAGSSATLLPGGHHRRRAGRGERLPTGPIGAQLVTVAPAAVRARLHDEIGAEIGARRLAERRALLTMDDAPPASPWYRVREVETVLPARPKAVRRWLRTAPALPLELVVHGLAADVTGWWRALGRPPRGPAGRRLELVRTDQGAVAILTREAVPPARVPTA